MTKINPSLMQDRQCKRYFTFLLLFCLLLFIAAMLFCRTMTASARNMLLTHDEAVASALIESGVPETVIAAALTETGQTSTEQGAGLLRKIGMRTTLETKLIPRLQHFKQVAQSVALSVTVPFFLLLLGASLLFLHKREKIYLQASSVINQYITGDYSSRLPQTDEGAVCQMLSAVDGLATMLQAQKEAEHNAKVFLKNTISDISHQLKTPLAALSMYQEIMESEPDHPAVIQKFTNKTGLALRRMEQLIDSLLKIARLDAGSIVFEKKRCSLSALVSAAAGELMTRAASEEKTILTEGSPSDTLLCDPMWTTEAIANLVKNALDHTNPHGTIRITWDLSPLATRIQIADDGEGIAPEDLCHIFKRFYRSSASLDRPGTGLGLPLAKSIVEGQGGSILVSSAPRAGTTFTILFMTP